MGEPNLPAAQPAGTAARPGTVYLVGAGPGDPGLLTLRGAELLATADVVLHDAAVDPAIRAHASPVAELRAFPGRDTQLSPETSPGDALAEAVATAAREGKSVVWLAFGDPFFFGGGVNVATALRKAGVPFEVVPGVPQALGAAAYAAAPLTAASSVTFARSSDLAGLSGIAATHCVIIDVPPINATVDTLLAAGLAASTSAVLVRWFGEPTPSIVEGPLGAIGALAHAARIVPPATLVVGRTVEIRQHLRWFDTLPLFGKRVLLTRPAEQSSVTASLVRRRGGHPIEVPAIVLGDPPNPARIAQAVGELGTYDVVVFTSENGVRRFFQALASAGLDARAFARARLAAIGPGTASMLLKYGVRADIVPTDFRGEHLAEAILVDAAVSAKRAAGKPRVLLARALVARDVVPDRLRAAGCEVDVVALYETRPAPLGAAEAIVTLFEQGGVDIVTLTSSSTAESLARLLGDRRDELLRGVLVASIGEVTTARAAELGLTVGVTATSSTLPGLIEAIERHLTASNAA